MSALERMKFQRNLTDRGPLLDDIRRISLNRWLRYAADHDLPTDPGRCSNEALFEARNHFFGTAPGGAKDMALKTAGKTAQAVAAAVVAAASYLVMYPEGKPQKATAVKLAGAAPDIPEGMVHVEIAGPKDLVGMPMPALLALVNAGRNPKVAKFTSDDTAQAAAWDAILARAEAPQADGTAKEPKARTIKVIAFPAKAKEEIKQVRVGTKVATAVDLLSRDGGVLLSEFETELSKTGKPISGRAWLGYDVAKVVGYGVSSVVEGEDLRLSLVLPKGMKAPMAHKTVEEKVKPEPKPKAEGPKSAAKAAEPAPEVPAEKPKAAAKKAAGKKSGK